MPTTDGYNGAYTGPQIDEGISKASTSMQPSVYDPQNKAQDVFGYVDSVAEGLIEYVEFTYVSGNNPDTVSSSRTFTEVKESINSGRLVLGRYGNYFYSVVSHDNSSVTFLCVTAVNYARTIILTLTNSASATYSNQNPLLKSGGTMTGPLTLSGDPAEDLQAAPKQYVDALKPKPITITLPASGWSNNQQTVTATGVTADNAVTPSPAPESWEAAGAAGVRCTAQGADSLTFTCSETPTEDLTYNVLIQEVMPG